jgi:hypothetical protein
LDFVWEAGKAIEGGCRRHVEVIERMHRGESYEEGFSGKGRRRWCVIFKI